jgi:RNA polymerase sigma-70 factor (ECF subfamily)
MGAMSEQTQDLAAALLAEAGWVRRLAARLVRDGSADDVVQEAWVRALKQRPDHEGGLGGWLAEVVRRLSHTRTRSDARRHDREVAVEVPRATPGADEMLERAELLRLLTQRVAELDEPYRSTVLLRYYEGLTSQQIAERQGVSDGTVRWRLKHALAELRTRLDGNNLRLFAPLLGGGSMLPALKLTAAALAVCGGVVSVHFIGRHSASAPAPVAAAAPANAPLPADADVLLRAQDAYVKGQFDDAIALAKEGMGQDESKAWRIIGASNCFLQNAEGAIEARDQLDAQGKKFIEYVCQRHDTPLPDGTPVM